MAIHHRRRSYDHFLWAMMVELADKVHPDNDVRSEEEKMKPVNGSERKTS